MDKINRKLLNLANSDIEVGGVIDGNEVYKLFEGTYTDIEIPIGLEKIGIIFHTHPITDKLNNWIMHSGNDLYECFRRFFSNGQKLYKDIVATTFSICTVTIKTKKKMDISNVEYIMNKIQLIKEEYVKEIDGQIENINKKVNNIVNKYFDDIKISLKIDFYSNK